jgi:hypothetical protein
MKSYNMLQLKSEIEFQRTTIIYFKIKLHTDPTTLFGATPTPLDHFFLFFKRIFLKSFKYIFKKFKNLKHFDTLIMLRCTLKKIPKIYHKKIFSNCAFNVKIILK